MDTKKVEFLLEEALAENPSLFLISLDYLPGNKIKVVVDGDSGVSLKECMRISRNIDHNMGEELDDFTLEVSSPDISEPLKVHRQYLKNLGRTLDVKANDQSFEGVLKEVTDDHIVLAWKAREPKPIGKGKVTVEKTATLTHKEISEAKVKIIF
ncbi:ribosome maturation factor RimP [Polaribacter pacificus]|uniref:Ribosome maturation factor RimP n=1 Tax=Polaribacter pacificus TaxID=1775173 RepID=A0A917HY45_9FLAO|nr:ribosome assembly cofactor RimP [Polaribacter pacificus]GGG95019.1 ribosome maturation factor RimP [Polaribacter pacificus]